MPLHLFVFRRLALLIPVLFGISILTFTISHLVPGDPARLAAGPQATPEMVEAIRQEFGLDRPLPIQYTDYLVGLLKGNWGRSVLSRRPVLEDLSRYWPATFELVVVAMFIAGSVGTVLGVISAVRHDSWVDHASRLIALIGVSIPAFWLAILVRFVLGLKFNWFPISGRLDAEIAAPVNITGMYVLDSLLTANWSALANSLVHITLPAVTLSFAPMATVTRMTRATMLEVLAQDYIRTARAKGLSERAVLTGHALKNAFIPTVTMMGLSFGWLMGGSVLVETIFDWPGIGLYAVNSALTLDFMPIMGIAILYGLIFSLINLLVDITYGFLDPRIRFA